MEKPHERQIEAPSENSSAARQSGHRPAGEQNAIIESDGSALIIAGPGRGKTATAFAAADAWLKRNPQGGRVLFTSFSNAAVRRIGEAAGMSLRAHERRLQFRTFHSVAMEVLRDFGRVGGLKRPVKTLDQPEERMIAVERGWDREYQRFLQAENRAHRERGGGVDGRSDAVARWAQEHQLPYEDGHVQLPDARLEYEDRDGRRAVENIEVVTPHYRDSHAAAKVRAGFTRYRAIGARLGGLRTTGRSGRGVNPRLAEELLQ